MKNKEIAQLIKKLRIDSGLTQEELAKSLGVSKPAISQWENGEGIKTINIYSLAKFFDVSMEELCNGKLASETNDEYIERNYDLSKYYFDGPINNDDFEKLYEFYNHVKMIKDKFYELLPKWANRLLDENETKAFSKIKSYFKFDVDYMSYIKDGPGYIRIPSKNDDIDFVKERIDVIKDFSKAEKLWELSKLYYFDFDLKRNEVCNSGSLDALRAMLEIIDQPKKDALLNNDLKITEEKEVSSIFGGEPQKLPEERELTYDEIEKVSYFKTMLNAGCNCMLKWKGIPIINDDEIFPLLDGNLIEKPIKENVLLDNFGKFSNLAGNDDLVAINYWKTCSLKEYQQAIDYDKTAYLKALVNKKDSNPLEYYKALRKFYE